MQRKIQGAIMVLGWLASAALFAFLYVTYYGTKLSYQVGFPGMPFYGAMSWWFFFTIPVIGYTWGFFTDLKKDG
jgi:TRAP-type C4-dicarboxylate transport system permease small subunit